MVTSTSCRCGATRAPNGLCTHCDARTLCPKPCARCTARDSHCVVCRNNAGSPSAAGYCEQACRAKETQRRV
jgi:hypothetical protein